jgi:hypothetical protein
VSMSVDRISTDQILSGKLRRVAPCRLHPPKKNTTYEDGRPGFEEVSQLYIDPVECCVAVRRYAAESSFLFFTSETLSMRIMDSHTTKRL